GDARGQALWRAGVARMAQGNLDAAVACLKEATACKNCSPKARLLLGRALYDKKDDAAALAALSPLERDSEVGAEASVWIARSLARQGKIEEAERTLARAPRQPTILHELARLALERGRFQESLALADEFL